MASANDGIANVAVVDKRVENLRNAGVESNIADTERQVMASDSV